MTPAALAVIAAAFTLGIQPTGLIAVAALLAGGRPLLRILVRRHRIVGTWPLVAPLLAAGTVVLRGTADPTSPHNPAGLLIRGQRLEYVTLDWNVIGVVILAVGALSGAVVYDPFNHAANGVIFAVPVTFDFSKELRLNINVGAQYNADPGALYATAGAGVSWNFVKQWSIISEIFALIGPAAANPRFQSGIRYSPTKDVDWDVIYGRNLTGEGANWITLALTFRIGDN